MMPYHETSVSLDQRPGSLGSEATVSGSWSGRAYKYPSSGNSIVAMCKVRDDECPNVVISDPNTGQRYERGRLLGKGGFAKVYEVTEIWSGQRLADKVIPHEFLRHSPSKEKVRREIQLHKELFHPNVVGLRHHFTDELNNEHLLMEYCSMTTLMHVVNKRKKLTEPEVHYFMTHICEGVRYLHHCGILHRDLKLDNMFLSCDMTLKIGDFGLATRMPVGAKSLPARLCGTPNYIAPEVLMKQGHCVESDLWAIGCMMFAMLVGSPPFKTTSLMRTYHKIRANDYCVPNRLSSPATTLIRQLLHPDPALRGSLKHFRHLDDVLLHPFFFWSFCPKWLPLSAASHKPQVPVKWLFESNLTAVNCVASAPALCQQTDTHLKSPFKLKLSKMLGMIRKRPAHPQLLLQMMEAVANAAQNPPLANGPYADPRINANKFCLSVMPVFVSKWIDLSNKHGFGYQLSDHSVGVLFNDGTRLSRTADQTVYDFVDAKGTRLSFCLRDSEPPIEMDGRIGLLDYFSTYMSEHLAEDRTKSLCSNHMIMVSEHRTTVPHVTRWIRSDSAVIMALNNNSVQINFFQDGTKLLLWGDASRPASPLITCIWPGQVPETLTLSSARLLPAMYTMILQSLTVLRLLAAKIRSAEFGNGSA